MKRFARLARLKMKTPTSLLRMLVLMFGISGLLVLAGCRKTVPSFSPTPPPAPTPVEQPSGPSHADAKKQAVAAVTAYIRALEKGKYATAYEMLSQGSRSLHSRASFERQGKQGMPQFDLNSMQADVTGDSAVVKVNFEEDPNAHEFNLTRESGDWKIVYRGGSPGMPYLEHGSSGSQKGDTDESNSD